MNLSFKPYSRQLKLPIKMSRGIIEYRQGIIIRLESDKLAFGEAVILDYFGTESLSRAIEVLNSLPSSVTLETLKQIPEDCFATRLALESALIVGDVKREMRVSKLLPAGSEAIAELKIGLAKGYQTFKWKIGSYQDRKSVV